MVDKISVNESTDDELLGICRDQFEECTSISWNTPEKGVRIEPPETTIAIVIDLTKSQGAFRFFDSITGNLVDMVGVEDAGKQVMVRWNSLWWLRMSGQLRIAYIAGK